MSVRGEKGKKKKRWRHMGAGDESPRHSFLKSLRTQKFDLCSIPRHRLPLQNAKIPWRKVCSSTNYPDVFSIKMLNIWVSVPIQVIGWAWPFSSGGLARVKHSSVGGILYVCDDLPSWIIYFSFSCSFELKMEMRSASLLLGKTHPRLIASESWHCCKEAAWLDHFGC